MRVTSPGSLVTTCAWWRMAVAMTIAPVTSEVPEAAQATPAARPAYRPGAAPRTAMNPSATNESISAWLSMPPGCHATNATTSEPSSRSPAASAVQTTPAHPATVVPAAPASAAGQLRYCGVTRYLANCFLLILPALVWNLLLTRRLPPVFMPAIFGKDIPSATSAGEAITRVVVLGMPLLMPLRMHTAAQWAGLGIYLAGLLAYALSWLMQIYAADSAWSTSAAGFLAPAYTPLLWLTGIALIGGSLFLRCHTSGGIS